MAGEKKNQGHQNYAWCSLLHNGSEYPTGKKTAAPGCGLRAEYHIYRPQIFWQWHNPCPRWPQVIIRLAWWLLSDVQAARLYGIHPETGIILFKDVQKSGGIGITPPEYFRTH